VFAQATDGAPHTDRDGPAVAQLDRYGVEDGGHLAGHKSDVMPG
jgi:hypothetical protein